mgnify:CR=1 FL=1
MNADVLLEHFHRLGDAPDAVPRLRRFILDLAVRGKLVEQSKKDEPAEVLLKKMATERVKLVEAREFRRTQPLPSVGPDERSFEAPAGWSWTRLGVIGDWGSGSTPSRGKAEYYGGAYTWLKSGELNDVIGLTGSDERLSDIALKECSFRLNRKDDVLIAMYGATIGKLAILGEDAVTNQAVCGCTVLSGIVNKYLFLQLLAMRSAFHGQSEGGAQPNISKEKIVNTPFPLPPLPEQHRIVAKVDELMALCDRLEAAQQRREQHRTHLTAATWQGLVSETEPETTQFALAQLPALTTRKEQVAALRQTILDLAVRGRLVKQDERDEPAEVLLKRIAKEKAAYQTGRKKEFRVDPLTDEELRFALPSSWTWARTNDVTVYVQRGKSPKYSLEKKIPVIAQKCVQWADFQLEKAQFIEPASLSKYGEERYVQDGDLLWNSTGHGSLGRLIVFRERFKGKYPIIVADSHVTVIRASKHINPDYLFCWFAGPLVQDEINDKSTGTTNQTELPVGTVLAYDVPLPPFPEQQRIVAKVDELMALCDRLEAALEKGEAAKARLLEAVLAVATSSAPPPPQVRQHPAATKTKPQQPTYPEPEEALPLAAEPVPRRRGPGRPRKAETQDLGTVAAAITGFLQAYPGWHARSAIVPGANIAASAWNAAINALLEAGKVERQGKRKGARYRVKK